VARKTGIHASQRLMNTKAEFDVGNRIEYGIVASNLIATQGAAQWKAGGDSS